MTTMALQMEDLISKETLSPVEELMYQTALALQACGKFEDWSAYQEDAQMYNSTQVLQFWQDLLKEVKVAARVANFTPEEKAAYEKRLTALKEQTVAVMKEGNMFSHWVVNQLYESEEYALDKEGYWKQRLQEFQEQATPYLLQRFVKSLF